MRHKPGGSPAHLFVRLSLVVSFSPPRVVLHSVRVRVCCAIPPTALPHLFAWRLHTYTRHTCRPTCRGTATHLLHTPPTRYGTASTTTPHPFCPTVFHPLYPGISAERRGRVCGQVDTLLHAFQFWLPDVTARLRFLLMPKFGLLFDDRWFMYIEPLHATTYNLWTDVCEPHHGTLAGCNVSRFCVLHFSMRQRRRIYS